MTISEAQLETWSHQGAITTSAITRGSVVAAIENTRSIVAQMRPEVYLQGSYGSSTNIYGNSDVDVVVQLNSVFTCDFSRLDAEQSFYAQFNLQSVPSVYGCMDFRRDVSLSLADYYGSVNISDENKCIKVLPGGNRLQADVNACVLHRRYYGGLGADSLIVEGIEFWAAREGRRVVNFPKQHREAGQSKNSRERTSGRFKHLVRIFKNGRDRLIQAKVLNKEVAPSYFVESLVFNVPDQFFGYSSLQDCVVACLSFLELAPLGVFVLQNGQGLLFGNTPEQWRTDYARCFIDSWRLLWDVGW